MTGAPLTQGRAVMGDEVSGVHADRDAVEVGFRLGPLALDGRVDEAGELRVGYAALNVVGEPSVLGGAELVERDETIATVAAATPLLNAWSSIGRSSGTSRSRSAPVGKATCMTALMLS